MNSNHYRNALHGALLIVLATLGACAASQASKVECDSKLRPINPTNREKSMSLASEEHRQP